MADNTPVGSLSEFLSKRAAAKAAQSTSQVTSAPTPKSESPSIPTKMAPPPAKQSFLRKAAGAVANEAFSGSGHIGRVTTERIRGDHKVSANYVRVPSPTTTSGPVSLSTPAKPPAEVKLGVAQSVNDIESQVIRIDKEVKDWGKYVTGEFASVRKDIKGVLDVTQKTQAEVDRMKKDLAEEAFRKRILDAKIRGYNGKLMTADQVQQNPFDVHPDQKTLVEGFMKDLKSWAAGAAAGGGGLYAKKKLNDLFRNRVGKVAAEEGVKVAEQEVVKNGATALEKKAAGSFAARVGKVAASRKGGSVGTAIDVLKVMKDDSQSGNHLRTWLRKKLGIEDPGEAAPWSGAMSNSDYEKAKSDRDEEQKDKTAKDAEEGNIKSDADIKIESKKDVSIKSVLNILLEARNELTLKGRVITIDAERLELKGGIRSNLFGRSNAGLASPGVQSQVGGENLSNEDVRYRDLVAQYGREKADEMMRAQSQRVTDPSYWVKKFTGRDKGDAYKTPENQDSPGYNPGGTGYRDVPSDKRTGKYRPKYELGDDDISDEVVNTIAGEAYTSNKSSVDAVIHNMMNRVGTNSYGPSGNLREVARAKGQYEGYRTPSQKEAEFIRERIKAIASGDVPDPTGGANEFRASYYRGPWAQKHAADGKNIGGNVFAYNSEAGLGKYAPYKLKDSEIPGAPASTKPSTMLKNSDLRIKGGLEGQATAGGNTHEGVFAAARALQSGLGNKLDHFSSFDDAYHHHVPYHSAHKDGLASDFSIGDGMSSDEAAEHVRKTLSSAGLVEGRDFKVRDEYANPSGAATGGHIHFQFQSQEAAQKFAQYQSSVESNATPTQTKSDMSLGPTDNQSGRPSNIKGTVNLPDVGDFKSSTYHGGSGGFGGDTAIPYGTYPIGGAQPPGPIVSNYSGSNAEVFPVGFGEGNRSIPDPKLGRDRTDIQIHSDNDASRLLSAGCLAIDKREYPKFLAHMKALIARDGPMVLRIAPSPAGQPHKFEIISAKQAAGSTNDKVTTTEAVNNFKKTGDINPTDAAPLTDTEKQMMDMVKNDKSVADVDVPKTRDDDPTEPKDQSRLPQEKKEETKDATPLTDTEKQMMELAKKDTASDADIVKTSTVDTVPPKQPDESAPPTETEQKMMAMAKGGDQEKTTAANSDTGSQGSSGGSRSNEHIAAPRHHPESEAPRPGSDGYGDQQQNPDDCGICSVH